MHTPIKMKFHNENQNKKIAHIFVNHPGQMQSITGSDFQSFAYLFSTSFLIFNNSYMNYNLLFIALNYGSNGCMRDKAWYMFGFVWPKSYYVIRTIVRKLRPYFDCDKLYEYWNIKTFTNALTQVNMNTHEIWYKRLCFDCFDFVSVSNLSHI